MKLLVKGNIYPSIETLEELNLKYVTYNNQTLIELPKESIIGKNADNKHLKEKHTPYYYREQLKKYNKSDDNSLESFVVLNHRIVASGNIKEDKNNKELLVCNGAFRVYTDFFTTFDLINAGEIGGEDLANFYEVMLRDSVIKRKTKSR